MRKFLLACIMIFASSLAFAGEFVKGDAIVVFKNDNGGAVHASVNAAVSSVGASIKTSYNNLSESDGKIFLHIHSDTKTTEQLITDLLKRDDVIAASPNRINYPRATRPNDEFYSDLWGLEKINAPAAWDITTGSENVYVAIIDSGIYEHEDLKANLALEYAKNFGDADTLEDSDGHGTHIAGIIGAVGNNQFGITGVNWKVKIIPIKAENLNGGIPDSLVIESLNYLTGLLRDNPDMKLAAVNFSFGHYSSMTPSQAVTQDAIYTAYKAFDNLNRALLVFASGNESTEEGGPLAFTEPSLLWQTTYGEDKPAFKAGDYDYPISYIDLNNAIAVGSIDSEDNATYFTNFGDKIHVAAPGDKILSTYNNKDTYVNMNGNSMATPYITGAAALLLSAYPDASASQIKQAILQGANSNINPYVYPFEQLTSAIISSYSFRVNISVDIGALTPEEGAAEIEKYSQQVKEELKDYQQFDGKVKVSKYGLLDLSASLKKLAEILENDENLSPENESTPLLKSSSSGCNSFTFAGLFIFAGFAIIMKRK